MAEGPVTVPAEITRPIDVWIIGGYLGAGKTTTLNALLETSEFSGRDPALIINEFGRIGVDGSLVERRDLTRYEINKGSLFCTCTRTDLLRALEQIALADHDALLIEATGIAEPVDLEKLLTGDVPGGRYRVRGNICIVDAEGFTRIAAFLKPALEQVRWADVIVINKCDLVQTGELEVLRRVLRENNQEAMMVETTRGRIQPEHLPEVLGARETRLRARVESQTLCLDGSCATGYPDSAPGGVFALSFTATEDVDPDCFSATVRSLGDHLLRLKGNVAFSDSPAFVELVAGRESRREPVAELNREIGVPTAFTVIAWNTSPARIRSAFATCGCTG
jgi:G3E family GTPase